MIKVFRMPTQRCFMIVPGNINQYISVTAASEVHLACQPMFDLFELNYFGYFRIYDDATCMGLLSDPLWFEHFITHGFSYQSGTKLVPGQHLWINTHRPIVYQHAREYFNHDHGLFVVEQKADYLESAIFATSRGNDKILDFYLNYPDLLKQFIQHFQHAANPLIKKASEKRMLLDADFTKSMSEASKIRHLFEQMFPSLPTQDMHPVGNKRAIIHLTKREKECLVLLCQGKSAKCVAAELFISQRTVETHVVKMREKFDCRNTTELVSKTLKYIESDKTENY